MAKRAVGFLVVIALLIGLLFYGQLQRAPRRISGVIEANDVDLGSLVGGRVGDVLVDEGQQVAADQLLVQLEPYDLLARKREIEARIAVRRAELERLERGFRSEEIEIARARYAAALATLARLEAGPRGQEIEVARAELAAAQAAEVLATQQYERSRGLAVTRSAPVAELDDATARLKQARALVQAREEQVDLLEEGAREEEMDAAAARAAEAEAALQLQEAGFRAEEIDAARAALAAAEAERDAVRVRIDELEVRAARAGRVESIDLHPGDLLRPGAPVVRIIEPEPLHVRAFIPEATAARIGQQVWITIDAVPSERFGGEIIFIATEAEFTPSNVQTPEERSKQVYRVKVRLDDSGPPLRPGLYVDLWLNEDEIP